jgi:tripartite-type tricarboxylate transporter receptor subunit TctC
LAADFVAEHLQQSWRQPVIVEPRPGAGGKIAVNAVLAAPPDGYTMLLTTPTYTLNSAMKVATYDRLGEFDSVAIVGLISYALVAHPSVPAKSVAELVDHSKHNPGKPGKRCGRLVQPFQWARNYEGADHDQQR